MTPPGFPSAISVGDSLALRCFVPGIELSGVLEVPPKDRHRARVVHGKKPWVQFYDTERNRLWEHHTGTTVLAQLRGVVVQGDRDFTLPLTGCRVLMSLRFNLRKPVSYSKKVIHQTVKPDLDNLTKSVLDALVGNGILPDDNCITDLMLAKRYADDSHPVGVEIEMTCLAL